MFRHSVGNAFNHLSQVVNLVLNVHWSNWNLGLGELALGKATNVFIDVLADGLTNSFSGFLDYAPGIKFHSSD